MRRIAGITILVFSVASCTKFIKVPDNLRLISNHRFDDESENYTCYFTRDRNSANTSELNPAGFSLLNWNVLKGSRDNWMHDFNRLSQVSDILILQEAQLHDEFHWGLEQSDMHWDLNTAFHYGDAATGVLIASSVKPGTVCSLRSNEPLINIPKTALVTEYRIKGMDQKLMIANIHMINFTLSTSKYKQQIVRMLEILQHHEGPIIVAGDFNTWSAKRMAIVESAVAKLGLDAVEFDIDHRLTIFGNQVDHVYFRGLETIHANTEHVESSDHNPMMVKFRLPDPEPM